MGYVLRRLESVEDYRACEKLQQEAWGFGDALDVIPLTQLVTAQKNGGLVLGAFDGAGELHGFCYGFLGRDSAGRLVHCSHMLAVDEESRNRGLGATLKWAQRKAVMAEGIELMLWTFDPLESLNACFNFGKLGGVSDEYLVNLYGDTTSRLHAGTPTDRLTLKWFLGSPRVAARAAGQGAPIADALAAGEVDAPWVLHASGAGGRASVPGEPNLGLDAPRLRCEVPASIQQVKAADPEAALAWRQATRDVFCHYFEDGYFARECLRVPEAGPASETRSDGADGPGDSDASGGADGSRVRTVYLLERGMVEPSGLTG